jgi:hypothetical protein
MILLLSALLGGNQRDMTFIDKTVKMHEDYYEIILIPIRFQDETNHGTIVSWPDHDESTKNW